MEEVITAPVLPSNLPLLSAFLSLFIAQFLKVFTHWFKERKWDTRRMLTSGGMPSSHSATVTSLAACIGLQEGIRSSSFAIAVVLACVVTSYKLQHSDSVLHISVCSL
ncbi:hypothetical protein HanOQP8_Chr00c176g0782571 [Helianthus annuus]|uniref:uncharacterized membrane protein YuiD isoform X2 n=1 Tax=Helianthus annuus TaxID=4232 RepID=UPI000B8F9E7F|nr:uncharacterized membrane protein YuiD isoform X2 [Helianthus annuus]KAJ0585953.1 hypothetical protein HanHA89_Chr05g0206561 [Helianthus annuus]KAJ0806862.1 hypothetical protein HanOQP8_Chr00c176g0782571 [Helianthus annuus]